eukprot:15106217-Alexandrium_andersonii.AAC.1
MTPSDQYVVKGDTFDRPDGSISLVKKNDVYYLPVERLRQMGSRQMDSTLIAPVMVPPPPMAPQMGSSHLVPFDPDLEERLQ